MTLVLHPKTRVPPPPLLVANCKNSWNREGFAKKISADQNTRNFDTLGYAERKTLERLHALAEITFTRVIESEISTREDAPFEEGYNLIQYLQDTIEVLKEWKTRSGPFWQLQVFESTLYRSYNANKDLNPNIRIHKSALALRQLKLSEKIWLGVFSNCQDSSGSHWMVLEVARKTHRTFDLKLVNIGSGAICANNTNYGYDLNVSNVSNSRRQFFRCK